MCKSLESIRFSQNLKYIGKEAFVNCSFQQLELPESLEVIEESGFLKCKKLTALKLPKNVKTIGKWAFHGCPNLKKVEIRHNPDEMGEWIFNRNDVTVHCYEGSKIDRYCRQYDYKVHYIQPDSQ